MRMFAITTLLIILGVLLTSSIVCAQETTVTGEKPGITRENISEEQLAILKANRSKQIEFRNAFRETLSGTQLDILTNPGLSHKAKLQSFRASLSDNQATMIRSNTKQLRSQKFELRSTLSNRKRIQIRRMGVNRAHQNRALFQRARLKRRLIRI